jgi:hypothetical protein
MLSNSLNFSGGPGALPASVLEQTQQAIVALPETGLSILGMSHRSPWFKALLLEAQENIRQLLNVPERYHVLFLQGGSSLQFSMIPMNFAAQAKAPAEFVTSGYWSGKAVGEAAAVVDARVVWDGAAEGYRRLPAWSSLQRSEHAPFFHYVSNETVEGLQFRNAPASNGVPLIADMSSDFLSRRFDIGEFLAIALFVHGDRLAALFHHFLEHVGDQHIVVGRRGAGAQFDVLVLDLGQHQPDGAEPRLVAAFHRGNLRSLDVVTNHACPHALQISERPSLAASFQIR